MQIERHVWWLEHAQAAADWQRVKTQTGRPDINIDSDEGMGINLNAHYEVPKFQNDPVNIYSFVHEHHKDLAIIVHLPIELKVTLLLRNTPSGLYSKIKGQHTWLFT